MTKTAVSRTRPALDDLTAKEVEVLELLAQHMTTKEIARALEVAPNTVEKRLLRVRDKWHTPDRNSTARLYRELAGDGWEKIPPHFPAHDGDGYLVAQPRPDLPKSAVFQLADVVNFEDFRDLGAPEPVGLRNLDRRFGKLWRIAAIPLLALVVGMVLVAALAFARTLTEMF